MIDDTTRTCFVHLAENEASTEIRPPVYKVREKGGSWEGKGGSSSGEGKGGSSSGKRPLALQLVAHRQTQLWAGGLIRKLKLLGVLKPTKINF